MCININTRQKLVQKLRNLLGGRGGGHYMITLDYMGGGGGQFGQTIVKAKNQRNPDF